MALYRDIVIFGVPEMAYTQLLNLMDEYSGARMSFADSRLPFPLKPCPLMRETGFNRISVTPAQQKKLQSSCPFIPLRASNQTCCKRLLPLLSPIVLQHNASPFGPDPDLRDFGLDFASPSIAPWKHWINRQLSNRLWKRRVHIHQTEFYEENVNTLDIGISDGSHYQGDYRQVEENTESGNTQNLNQMKTVSCDLYLFDSANFEIIFFLCPSTDWNGFILTCTIKQIIR
ncbi:hypothetical protein PSHT_05118 [Puccinia striiformis]|uniref:Uncharacterized protein n=1 Tax=Puccinia striiformis TaxID=27350 RepID=A0A2S4WBA5_9BASI|nr:hypothetical protein PSHT_05118 [Puccinia striiformis]